MRRVEVEAGTAWESGLGRWPDREQGTWVTRSSVELGLGFWWGVETEAPRQNRGRLQGSEGRSVPSH